MTIVPSPSLPPAHDAHAREKRERPDDGDRVRGEDRPDDEERLLEEARAGDPAAFCTLFDRHVAELEGSIRRRMSPGVRRKVSVSDVVQEARIVAFQKLAAFERRGAGAFRAWLLAIARLQAHRAVRRHASTAKRDAGREVSRADAASSPSAVAHDPSPVDAAIASEVRESVARTLARLPPDYREVLRLTQFEGLTLRDAAERMGRTREATKKLYGRAMIRFTSAIDSEARP